MINGNIVYRNGKQLLVNNKPLADVCDERFAHALQIILLRWSGKVIYLTDEETAFLSEVFPEAA